MKNFRECFFCISEKKPKTRSSNGRDCPVERYTLKELVHATNNFRNNNKIGGGYGSTIYWGRTSKGVEIAVKRLRVMTAIADMEFALEVEILNRVKHNNLLGLRGYYAGGDERLIVCDYMPNHSLFTHLHGQFVPSSLLDWPRRMKIAIGLAEGLAYLHHETIPHIIHRHLDSSNVLLDSEFQAKIADFGFAKLIPEGASHLTTRRKGTLGYIAPEYAMWGKVSRSCDVYSFGILILEIISARKPLEKLPGGLKRYIVEWATPFVQKGAFNHIVDPRLKGDFDCEELKRVIMIAMKCTNWNPENRPSMLEVMGWLKDGMGSRKKEIMVDELYDEEEEDNAGMKKYMATVGERINLDLQFSCD